MEYTRVSEDTAILLLRNDFPRAVNVLQRRAPDLRRWRTGFRCLASRSNQNLEGTRRRWVEGALSELLDAVDQPWIRNELVYELHSVAPEFGGLAELPVWTARSLWRTAEEVGLPMEYLVRVTELPKRIDEPLQTARVIRDFRAVSQAHRRNARQLSVGLRAQASLEEALPMEDMLQRVQVEAQTDAAERWRRLANRLLHPQAR